ncbi:MAG: SMP-30/gluconolactonase/LRE family protein [Leptonema sp. (in: Bacteria)]|nr:SMP-30/gluconolactonase/LRE family protein [Leptonema sp. (in: bacteria)]
MKKLILWILIPIAIIALFIIRTLVSAGQFKTIESYSEFDCKPVEGFAGGEDIVIDHSTGTAFLSYTDRRLALLGQSFDSGILSYSLLESNPIPRKLEIVNKQNESAKLSKFAFHGIDLFNDADGRRLLYVINHESVNQPAGYSVIEIFEYKNNQLYHVETIKDKELRNLNDVVAVGPRQFYATVDHGATSTIGQAFENYLQSPISHVVYFDGQTTRHVAGGIAYANGIAVSHDGQTLYVAGTVSQKIYLYSRNLEAGDLTKKESIYLGTGVDNIDIDEQGVVWIGSHPKLLSFVEHSKDQSKLSPSEVVTLTWQNDTNNYKPKTVYLNDGSQLSGLSVAAAYRNRVLLGTVFESKFLDCTRK